MIEGSGVLKPRPNEHLWALWFDGKLYLMYFYYKKKQVVVGSSAVGSQITSHLDSKFVQLLHVLEKGVFST